MKSELFLDSDPGSVPLEDKLGEVAREERQRALRALLKNPLLTAEGPHAPEFGLVRRHVDELREWLAHHPNWTLQVTSEFARLRKVPPDSRDRTRAARDNRTGSPFTRSRYVLLCLALAALERSERQTTLGRLAEMMLGFFAADAALAQSGLVFDLKSADQRRDLVQVIRSLCDRRVLWRRQGDEDQFVRDAAHDVLYNVNRPLLTALLCVRRGPSTISASGFEERLAAIVEEPAPDTDEAENRRIRVRLFRSLLDNPVLYYETLNERERAYLDRQRGFILRHITDATGLIPEVRAEGIALVDDRGELTDLALPEEGTDGHLTLLLAEFLANRLRRDRSCVIGFAELCAHTAGLIVQHKSRWRKDVTEPGADRVLTESTLDRLEALQLVHRTGEGIRPLPAIARYALFEVDESSDNELPLL